MRNGVKYEQRRSTTHDEDGVEHEWTQQLAFCLRHREQSELCLFANSKSGIRKSKKKPKPSDRVVLSCPCCRDACNITVRTKQSLLGLRRDYALSKQTNRIRQRKREESKVAEDAELEPGLESEDEQPTANKPKPYKRSPPPPPADSIAVQRGRRGRKKKQQQQQREQQDEHDSDEDNDDEQQEQQEAGTDHRSSADEMPLDDVDDSALVSRPKPSSSSLPPSSASPAPFPLPSRFADRPFLPPSTGAALPFPGSCVRPHVYHSVFARHWRVLDRYRRLYEDSGLSEHSAHPADSAAALEAWMPYLKIAELVDIFDAHGWRPPKTTAAALRHELALWIQHEALCAPTELIDDFMSAAQVEQNGHGQKQGAEGADRVVLVEESDADEDDDDGGDAEIAPSAARSQPVSSSARRKRGRHVRRKHQSKPATPPATATTSRQRPSDTQPNLIADASPHTVSPARRDRDSPPVPPLVPQPSQLLKLDDFDSPRRLREREALLADEKLCLALQAMQVKSWDAVGINRQFKPEVIESLLTLHGYSCQLSGQPAPGKLQLSTLVRLIHGGKIRTADVLRAELRAAAQKEKQQSEQAERISIDSESDGAPKDRARKKRQAEDSLQRRREEKKKTNKRSKHSSEEESKEGNGMQADGAAQTARASRVEQHIEHEDMNVDEESEGDVELTHNGAVVVPPPVLPRIDRIAGGGSRDSGVAVAAVDPPANIRRDSILSPTSGGSSRSNIPSSQSTFPSSQSSGAVTVQRAISFSSAEQHKEAQPATSAVSASSSSASSTSSSSSSSSPSSTSTAASSSAPASAPSSSSSSPTSSSAMSKSMRALLSSLSKAQSRLTRYAEKPRAADVQDVEDEVGLMLELLEGYKEKFRQAADAAQSKS